MKERVKRFFIEKKELLIFIGVVVLVFTAVITISSLAMKDRTLPVSKETDVAPSSSVEPSKKIEEPTLKAPQKFALPVKGEYEIVREFFDKSLGVGKLDKAVIQAGSYYKTSSGIAYAMKDNSQFDCLAVYDGVVTDVVNDELKGATVTIRHADMVYSIYSSLTELKVNKGDKVTQGSVIGKASTTTDDIAAGVHVFLEIKVKDELVNPASVIGKEIEEVMPIK